MKTILVRLLAVLFCLSLFASSFTPPPVSALAQEPPAEHLLYLPLLSNQYPRSAIYYSNPVHYQVTKSVTVANTAFSISRLRLYLPSPINWDTQTVQLGGHDPSSAALAFDATYGNGILIWDVQNLPAKGQTLTFQETFTVTVYEVESELYAGQAQPYDPTSSLYQLYTRSENYVEAADPLVVAAMQAAVGSETDPLEKAHRIYQYVMDHVYYQLNETFQGARKTLELGHGECGDYSAVFAAMARAAGIPARLVVGYRAYSGEAYHVWAEFYLEGLGWVPVDATDGDAGGDAFGRLGSGRIILSKGTNIPLPGDPYNRTAAILQTHYRLLLGTGSGITFTDQWEVKP